MKRGGPPGGVPEKQGAAAAEPQAAQRAHLRGEIGDFAQAQQCHLKGVSVIRVVGRGLGTGRTGRASNRGEVLPRDPSGSDWLRGDCIFGLKEGRFCRVLHTQVSAIIDFACRWLIHLSIASTPL